PELTHPAPDLGAGREGDHVIARPVVHGGARSPYPDESPGTKPAKIPVRKRGVGGHHNHDGSFGPLRLAPLPHAAPVQPAPDGHAENVEIATEVGLDQHSQSPATARIGNDSGG